jgi:hypothetical protein
MQGSYIEPGQGGLQEPEHGQQVIAVFGDVQELRQAREELEASAGDDELAQFQARDVVAPRAAGP